MRLDLYLLSERIVIESRILPGSGTYHTFSHDPGVIKSRAYVLSLVKPLIFAGKMRKLGPDNVNFRSSILSCPFNRRSVN